MVIRIPMEQKEIMEGRRAGIPEQVIGKMSMGHELTENEKEIVRSKGKVYVEAYRKDGTWVKPQLRDLPDGGRLSSIVSQSEKSEEDEFEQGLSIMEKLIIEDYLEKDWNVIYKKMLVYGYDENTSRKVADEILRGSSGGRKSNPSVSLNNLKEEEKYKFVYPEGKWVKSGNTISKEDKIVLGNKGQIQIVREGDYTHVRVDYNQLKGTLQNQLKHAKLIRDLRWESRLKKEQKNLEELYKRAEKNSKKPYKHWEEYRFERAVAEGHFIPD